MFSLDSRSGKPIYEQLYNKIFELSVSGVIKADEKLPAVRQLAKELGVNPNTVQKAYAQLEHDGIIYSQGGRGSFIAPTDNLSVIAKNKVKSDFEEKAKAAISIGVEKAELISIIENIERSEPTDD